MARGPGIALRPLLGLTAAVLLAHLVLLGQAPAHVVAPDPLVTRAWTTRTVVLVPPPAAAAPDVFAAPVHAQPAAHRKALAPTPAPVAHTVAQVAAPAASPAPAPAVAASTPLAPPIEAATPTPLAVPGSTRLLYDVQVHSRLQTLDARGELLWRHDGSQYEARMTVSALLGARVQTSSGQIGPQGLAPTRFADKSRRELAAHFDRDQARVVFSANTPEAPLLAGAQDRVSVLLQLASMLAGDPARYPPGASITVQTIGPREAEMWQFDVEGQEALPLAAGEVRALKLVRHPRREFDARVEAWFDPQRSHLPVRVRLTQPNGDWLDQRLRATESP